jgi:ankyrin repeat protein
LGGKAGGSAEQGLGLVEKSAAQGEPEAYYALAVIHDTGRHAPKDKSRSCALFDKAAAKGHADAMFRAATCSLKDPVTPEQIQQVNRLVRQAARSGSQAAAMTLRLWPDWPAGLLDSRPEEPPQRRATTSPPPSAPAVTSKKDLTFFDAARDGNEAAVRKFLADGTDVNMRDTTPRGEEQTALHHAMRAADPAVAAVLIEHGANVNARANSGYTPLHVAAGLGKVPHAKLLLGKGAFVDAVDSRGMPIHAAVLQGQQGMVELLLKAGANPNARTPRSEDTPLTLLNDAMHYVPAHDAIIRLLVEAGADVNARSKYGNRPIQGLARGGEETTLFLLDKGATTVGARIDGHPITFEYAKNGKLRVLERLISSGHALDERSYEMTLLHYVAAYGDAKTAQWLIGKGLDVNIRDKQGGTPLHSASARAKDQMISFLLGAGADPNAEDADGRTPLFLLLATPGTARYAEREILKALPILRKGGARFDHADRDGVMPLHWYVMKAYIGIHLDVPMHCEIAFQIAEATGVEARTRDGDNVLHVLARRPAFMSSEYIVPKFAECLADMGAKAAATNRFGETPLDVARKHIPDAKPLAQFLVERLSQKE